MRTLARRSPWSPSRQKRALALAGGGVIGGMYEVGAVAAIEEHLGSRDGLFDVYVGCSAGAVVASLLANGIRASEVFRILDQDLDDPLNFRRGAVYGSDSFRRAAQRFGRLLWALARRTHVGLRRSVPDMLALASAEHDIPPGLFSVTTLEGFLRRAYAARGLHNSFAALERTLLIPAVDVDTAERVVFGRDPLDEVPIAQAIAASSAIPGFFEPYTIAGRDYIDGGVGFCGHADLAAESGADVVVVINPLVPTLQNGGASMRQRGLYMILEQANRIGAQNLLRLGLATLRVRYPGTRFVLLEPPRTCELLFGPSMAFESSRAALRYGYMSTKERLAGPGAELVEEPPRLRLRPSDRFRRSIWRSRRPVPSTD